MHIYLAYICKDYGENSKIQKEMQSDWVNKRTEIKYTHMALLSLVTWTTLKSKT